MADDSNQDQEFDDLLCKLVDDSLSDEEFNRLSAMLAASEEFQVRYLNYIQLHTELAHRWGTSEFNAPKLDSIIHGPAVQLGLTKQWRATFSGWPQWLMIASVFLLGVGVNWLWNNSQHNNGESIQIQIAEVDAVEDRSSDIESFVRQTVHDPPVDAAVVVHTEDLQSSDVKVGMRLKPGALKFASGVVQLEFMSGALVAIEGPAELKVESKDLATLLSGKAVAHCPDRARGFVLNAPHAAVVDLGTDFSIHIDQDGIAEVGLISGEVELSLLGDDGATLVSKRITDVGRTRVDQKASTLTSLSTESQVELPEILHRKLIPLGVDHEYVSQVKRDGPFLYWRFEDSGGHVVANEMSDDFEGRLALNDSEENAGLRLADGYAHFDRVDSNRYITIARPIPEFNESEFSIEIWVRPDDLQHATCLGVVPEPNQQRFAHLNVIEVITDSFLIHEPGSIRFLHRNPPSHNFSGTNLFSPGICTPGIWQHIVGVKDKHRLKLYLDGVLLKDVSVKDHYGPGNFNLIVGQLKPFVLERQFSGGIDELAIYRRALSETEVLRHYELAVKQR